MGFFSHLWLCPPKPENRQASEGGISWVSHFQIEQICTTNNCFVDFPGKHQQTFNNGILDSLTAALDHEECMDGLYKLETKPEVTTELVRNKQRGRVSKPDAFIMSYLSVLLCNSSNFCLQVISCQATSSCLF